MLDVESQVGVESRDSKGFTLVDNDLEGIGNLRHRQAHNLKVVGSNPTPATNQKIPEIQGFQSF